MSWQTYIDNQLLGSLIITKAVIAGHDGTVWGKSNNVNPAREELKYLADNIPDQTNLTMAGVVLDGEKYFYLSGTDKVVRCKKGKAGLHAMKTHKAILVAIFEEPVQHPQVASVVEGLGDYLMALGY